MAWWGSGSPGAGMNIPRRPKAQGGFDSRPVADAATSGDRRLICMMTHAHRHGTAPVASRCAPTQHRDRAQNIQLRDAARPARKGQGEPVNNLNSILLEGNLAREGWPHWRPPRTARSGWPCPARSGVLPLRARCRVAARLQARSRARPPVRAAALPRRAGAACRVRAAGMRLRRRRESIFVNLTARRRNVEFC